MMGKKSMFEGCDDTRERGVQGYSIPTHSPSSVAVLDGPDPAAGGGVHIFGVQYGGPADVLVVGFQHGARGEPGAVAGVFDDDLLAIVEKRLRAFQAGPFACGENGDAIAYIMEARRALGQRVADRIARGVLGANKE